MEFRHTQIGRIVEQIKTAIVSHTPIVYIPTNEVELLQDILYNPACTNSLIPRLRLDGTDVVPVPDGVYGTTSENGKFNGIKDNYIEQKTEPRYIASGSVPTPFAYYPLLMYSIVDDFSEINKSLFSFACRYQGLKTDTALDPKVLSNLKRSVWIVVTPQLRNLPNNIAPYVKIVDVPSLKDDEILDVVFLRLRENGIDKNVIDEDLRNQIKVILRGLSSRTIVNIIDKLICIQAIDYDMVRRDEILKIIRSEKRQMLNNSNGLKWENVKVTNAAGLEGITEWLDERLSIFEDPEMAMKKHIDIPNGLLVSGIPGSGKSLMAKTAAYKLGLPLISLDMGSLLGGIMGESEHNMINALDMAEKMSPCVLWIDEIEKAFSGSSQNSSSSDGGVGRRMFGKFLTWMQEKSSACFVFATSNDITCLPPELFRSERFDRKFFTFMPMAEDCAKIFCANISGQEKAYQAELDSMTKEEKSNVPRNLFSEELTRTETWLKVLNDCCTNDFEGSSLIKDENDILRWKNGKRPTNKLFTGADISSIIKEAKFKVSLKVRHSSNTCVYDTKEFIVEIQEIIKGFQPYGETNLHDIVKCFRSLYQNRFNSAADKCIVDFNNYDDDKQLYIITEDGSNSFRHRYDKVLFNTIVGAINYYSNEKG